MKWSFMKKWFILLAVTFVISGCSSSPIANPIESTNVTKDGRIYRETETTEFGTPRSTVKVRAAEF